MGRESTSGQIKGSISETGWTIKWREKEFSRGKTGGGTRESTKTTKKKGIFLVSTLMDDGWGSRSSFGVFVYADSRKYEGQWKNGKQHGNGVYFSIHGDKREGLWDQGERVKWIKDDWDD